MRKHISKTAIRLVAGTAVAALLSIGAGAAGFAKVNTYTEGQFTDVKASEWYAAEVKSTFELGLMKGTGNGIFNPTGNVTIAEAVTMAANAASQYAGDTIEPVSGAWYMSYVNYGIKKGFVKENQFDNFTRAAKRYEVAEMFKNAMPDGYFTAKNAVDEIPDISEKYSYHKDLLTLYRAGVVMGSDSYGNFRPEDNITRAEAAAIINRVALPQNRLSKTLDKVSNDDAYILNYNTDYAGMKEGISSGWKLDSRGQLPRTSYVGGYGSLVDVSETEGTAMIREFNKIKTGVITLENMVTLKNTNDGFSLEYRNEAGNPVYRIVTKDGKWQLQTNDGSYVPFVEFGTQTYFNFKIIVDLENNRSTTIINKKNCGTYPLITSGEDTNILNFRFATTEESIAAAAFGIMKITANYAVNDDFYWNADSTMPYGWTGKNAINAGGVLKVSQNGTATNSFNPVSGTVIAQTKVNLTNGQSIGFNMYSGSKNIVKFTSDGANFYANGEKVYDNYVKNLWYTIRLEANTFENKAKIYVNGNPAAEVELLAKTTSIDKISLSNASADAITFDDVLVFEKIYHDDYVPVPVKPAGEEKYNVGINVCSLWRNGDHWGWGTITPYDDLQLALGYYDEGNPETADWEIKYMVEHGIDFQAFCWFGDAEQAPLKNPTYNTQLHDGYKYAEYSDMMNYCLIWEAANGKNPKSLQAFKDYYVPYLIEHYFKDDRYMKLDNQIVLCMFGASTLADKLGGVSVVKEAFDYLEEEVKKLGYDGVIYLACGSSSETLAEMGFDGSYAYNWGTNGYKFDVNRTSVYNSAKIESMYTVPTISVGFNSVPWHNERYPLMSVNDYYKSHLWARDVYLKENAKAGTWQENLVMLSTWNEYGEGTYIMPSEGNGKFGYLDVLREMYTSEKADESLNTVPTAAQRERINHLYPQYRRILKKEGYYKTTVDSSTLETVYKITFTSASGKSPGNIKDAQFTSEGLKGKVNGDALIVMSAGISADEAKFIKVKMKVPQGTGCEFYFITEEDQTYNGAKSKMFGAHTSAMNEYIIDMSENELWKGVVSNIRLDPGQTGSGVEGHEFIIESVEFMKQPTKASRKIHINDLMTEMNIYPEYSSTGDYLIAFDPSVSLDYKLNVFHTWSKSKGELILEGNGHKVVYTVGSSEYELDGKKKDLGFELYAIDGLPMIPIYKLCWDIGYEYDTNEENEAVIYTNEKNHFAEVKNRIPGQWEFKVMGDTESWRSDHFDLFAEDGYMHCETTGATRDPIIVFDGTKNFVAEKYNKFEIRCRYKYDATSPHAMTMYFTTDLYPNPSESLTIKAVTESTDSNGEWETYTVDLTENPMWGGKITWLRFDPFNALGYMDIDYIRFIVDENYKEPVAGGKFQIHNGDAENTNVSVFFSENSKITRIVDPDDENNHIFLVKSNVGQQWAYFKQKTEYKPGKKYTIEFDIKLVGAGEDIEGTDPTVATNIHVNMRYSDGSTTDHIVSAKKVSVADGWVHYEAEHIVKASSSSRSSDQFTIYANPVGSEGANYYIDNLVVKEEK